MEKHTNNEGMKFKVGDRVRVLDGSKIRKYRGGWVTEMRKYVGGVYTICEVRHGAETANGYYLKDGGGYIYDERGLKLDINNKIVITTDGKTTLARLYDGNNVIKSAEAKCSPDDEFDFSTGAKIAFERLKADDYDYDTAFKFFKSLCHGSNCDKCYLGKYAKKLGESSCMNVVSIGLIYANEYSHAYLEKIKAEIEKMQREDEEESGGGAFFNGNAVYLETEPSKWSRIYNLTKGNIYTFVDGNFTDDNGQKCSARFKQTDLMSQGFAEIKE